MAISCIQSESIRTDRLLAQTFTDPLRQLDDRANACVIKFVAVDAHPLGESELARAVPRRECSIRHFFFIRIAIAVT